MSVDQVTTGQDDLDGLSRGAQSQVRSFFHVLGERLIPGTLTSYRVYWLMTDANGNDRTNALARHIYYRITDYCTPRSRIDEAHRLDALEGGNMHFSQLQDEARRLFLDADASGEGGELLLFFLLEAELRIPQILCKMPLKTNSQMPIHGVDGVHASLLEDGKLAVYWGESKLYKDVQSAMTSCFDSIEPFLLDDGTGIAHRDFTLVRDNLDVKNRDLALKLVRYFTDDAPERNLLEIRGACLVGFDNDPHERPFFNSPSELVDTVGARIESWSSSIGTRVTNRKIDTVEIEFFCLPLPSVKKLRDEFKTLIGM